jgi:hypothetical protein
MGQNNGSNPRPKLELNLNEEAPVKLLRDKPATGSSNYGPYYLYSVRHEGVEKSWFAPEELHAEIAQRGLKSVDEFAVRKVAVQDGKKLSSRLELVLSSNGKDHSTENAVAGDGLRESLLQCIRDAVDIVKESGIQFSNEELQKMATTLFIQRSRLA